MKNLCLTVVLAALTSSALLAACGDDPSVIDQTSGGAGGGDGNQAGTSTGGKATGGSNNNSGGTDGGASPTAGGAGGEMTGEGGTAGQPALVGGAAGEAAGGAAGETAGGAAGAGGAGSNVVYQCNDLTQSHKLCSAFKAAACVPATDCADCVTTRNSEHEPFEDCAACQVEYDAFEQCGIDAFESGNLTSGIECVPDFGADLQFENCYPMLDSAIACLDYTINNPCPASWPIQ